MGATLETLIQDNHQQLDELQSRIGYQFKNVGLLQLQVTNIGMFGNLHDRGNTNRWAVRSPIPGKRESKPVSVRMGSFEPVTSGRAPTACPGGVPSSRPWKP